jgi:hypothetical protein
MKLWRCLTMFFVLLGSVVFSTANAQSSPTDTGWIEVRYDSLIDGRTITHSGEPLSTVLRRLGGRPFPEDGSRSGDRQAHQLIDPLLEPFGFVLIDALDTLAGVDSKRTMVELGSLWLPGEAQPAWVELLRSRQMIVESDAAGRMRLILPYRGQTLQDDDGFPLLLDSSAAESAWRDAMPVLRHVLRAELRRLASEPNGLLTLELDIHAYVPRPERAGFLLGRRPKRLKVDEKVLAVAAAPPLDLMELQSLFGARKAITGARLRPGGGIEWWTAEGAEATGLFHGTLTLADLAVAWRAVAHGGRAEPYMSLDRSSSPWTSQVNYGGRLRDTRLGWVSLLCDVRFKTFSNGLGFFEGRDLRDELRQDLPAFATHVERLARDPRAARLTGQQTRMWFYPDTVDLTVSPQLDVLGLRSVRMSAASERLSLAEADSTELETPPWTQETIRRINGSYDKLAKHYPEMRDLDQVVRMLSVATWLQAAGSAGRTIPDMDALLDLTLPATPTPRSFPQLLAFHALPPAGKTTGDVWALDRLPLAEAWARTDAPWGERPDAVRAWTREREALDAGDSAQASWLNMARGIDPKKTPAVELDLMTYRARRLRMHRAVLSSLDADERQRLLERRDREGTPRLFSLGIGGIDLGLGRSMQRALGSAGGGSLSLVGAKASRPRSAPVASRSATTTIVDLPVAVPPRTAGPQSVIPSYGSEPSLRHSVTVREAMTLEQYHPDTLDSRIRILERDDRGRVVRITRREAEQRWSYLFLVDGKRMRARAAAPPAFGESPVRASVDVLPDRIAAMTLREAADEEGATTLWIDLHRGESAVRSAEMTARVLRRILLGPEAPTERQQSLPGWEPPPRELIDADAVVIWGSREDGQADWLPAPRRFGEAIPGRLARGLNLRLDSPVVIGMDGERSLDRLTKAHMVPKRVPLVLPRDAFPFPHEDLRAKLAAAWTAGPVLDAMPDRAPELLVLAGAESGSRFGERIAEARAGDRHGSLLVWNLTETPRTDRLHGWREQGGWNSLALAEGGVLQVREAERRFAELSRSMQQTRGEPVFTLGDSFLWYY